MPHWSIEDIKTTLGRFKTPSGKGEWGFDVFYCPVDLFDYLADITFLCKVQPDSKNISQEVIEQAMLFGKAIDQWDASDYSGPRLDIVEVWRLGILLYLIRLFQLPEGSLNTTNLVSSIFQYARTIPPRTSWGYSMSWPLFQAGLLLPVEDAQNKTWLRSMLYNNFYTLGCLHQKLAVEALEQVWKSGKDCVLSDPEFLEGKLIL
ncbi:hypothetical protein H2204_005941 [Knufia peltigerae]|uniref:Uncharacterized protein n=1 Tax=Knufia peltigerae TaxID=1002370 RepID=A0AA39CYA6_9EURO|nr:hypothetical protein H2204_005941 [Knufia peltigerae]